MKPYFPALDALRTLACLLVFATHVLGPTLLPWMAGPGLPARCLRLLFDSGWIGVQVFFVLSGFLITHLLLRERSQQGRVDLPAFYLRRALRIWPMFALVVAAGFGLIPWIQRCLGVHEEIRESFWAYALFLGNFDLVRHGLFEGQLFRTITWSLAVEEQFYLVWPVLLRRGHAFGWALLAWGVSLTARAWWWKQGAATPLFFFHTLAITGDLACGALLAACAGLPLWQRVPRPAWGLVHAGWLGALLFRAELEGLPLWLVWGRSLLAVLWALVIAEQCLASRPLLPLARCTPLVRGGPFTYSVYLLHPFAMLLPFDAWVAGWPGPVERGLGRAVLVGLTTLGGALLARRVVEQPALRLKKRWEGPTPPARS